MLSGVKGWQVLVQENTDPAGSTASQPKRNEWQDGQIGRGDHIQLAHCQATLQHQLADP